MYKPKPIDTSSVILSDDIVNLIELISRNIHENWSENKIKDGWVWGEELDATKKTHPSITEYENLSEEEKNYDRTTVTETIKTLIKMGYNIN